MFLQIGNTLYNQETLGSITVYVEESKRIVPAGITETIRQCSPAYLSSIEKPFYKVRIKLFSAKDEIIDGFIISDFSGEDLDCVKKKAGELREKLFQNLGIHNIKIDLDTGEIVC